MCDFQTKLIAWLDRELPEDQADEVERHVQGCDECRAQRERFERVSRTFDAYCDAVAAVRTHRSVPRWIPAVSRALLAISATILLLTFQRPRIDVHPVVAPVAAAAPVEVAASEVIASEPVARKTHHTRPPVPSVQERVAEWQPVEVAVQITIPAETMFAPGAIPQGMNFVAELSISPDGSVDRLRLRP